MNSLPSKHSKKESKSPPYIIYPFPSSPTIPRLYFSLSLSLSLSTDPIHLYFYSTTTINTMDSSDSSSSEDPCTTPQLQRMGSGGSSVVLDPETGAEAESRKLPSSQYKGVVPQPNGRWGAQIYEKHQRVWLGTFDSEPAAARSYDVAAQRFRGRDAVTNFTPLSASNPSDATQLEFLARHSKAEIVDMLRKHTYADELRQSGLTFSNTNNSNNDKMAAQPSSGGGGGASASREHLFDKTVTPSDVGKLNRLVIPKQHAERHLPLLRDGGPESVLISFEDAGDGKVWRFRYSYWNSSQSYVLTKGWSRFVKEKKLVAGDTVRFLRDKDGGEGKLYVECRTANGSEEGVKVVRLFGVDIFRGGDEMMMKRKRGLDLDQVMESSRFFKKKFVGVL